MKHQMQAALTAMSFWLEDEHELGKKPSKIECAGEFDLHGLHYYIFRYKKGLLGKWMLGVCGGYKPDSTEHCGHIFSEMEEYLPDTAEQKCIRMVEALRTLLMQKAQEEKKKQERLVPPPYERASISPSQEQRKARSISILKEYEVPYIEHLPVISAEEEVIPRTPEEIAKRALACLLTVQVACDIAHDTGDSSKFFSNMLQTYGVEEELTPKEREFFWGKLDHQTAGNMSWKYEAYWPLIWSLGLLETLDYPDDICDCEFAIDIVRSCDNFEEFMQKTKPRSISEILDEADLIFRYNWACVNARLHGEEPPADLNPGVVMERHWGLNWLIGKQTDNDLWDTVSTDT